MENQTEALIIKCTELGQKFKSQYQTVYAVEVGVLISREQDAIIYHGDVWQDPITAENIEFSDFFLVFI